MRTLLPRLLVLAVLSACSKPTAAPAGAAGRPAAPVPVLLRPVRTQAVQVEVQVNGTLFGDEDVTLSSKVAGRVLSIEHDVGDRVAAGAPLLRIDPVDYALAAEQKQLAVRESLAKLGLSELPAADFDPAAVPVVRRAQLLRENAEAKFQRTEQLFEQQPPRVTAQEHDDARTEAAVARSNHDLELLNARAIVDEARTRAADLSIARQHLADCSVSAPSARPWAVSARLVSTGEYVREAAPLFHLVDETRVKLRAPVPERRANEVAVGQKVLVSVESSSEVFEGSVARINPQIDAQNRTFEVEILLDNARGLLHPGAYARARIQTRLDPAVVFVPEEALLSFAGVEKVFVVEDGQARAVEVRTGEREGQWIAVRSGLAGGESVVVSGNTKLATGTPVAAQPAPESAR
jgi:membrane fusion protein (multidrug efflux system)